MLLFDRRQMILGVAALAGCGFTPVYGPNSGPAHWALPKVTTRLGHLFHNALLADGIQDTPNGAKMQFDITTSEDSIGQIADGSDARHNLIGQLDLWREADKDNMVTLRAFTGYDASGTAIAVRAAKRDAEARLMVLLARQAALQLTLWTRSNT